MKHLKLFEKEYINKPQRGDYVVCTDLTISNKNFLNFLENNIGLVVGTVLSFDFPYVIQFKNAYMSVNKIKTGLDSDNCRRFGSEEILYFSKKKEDCEAYITAKKYNL